MKSETIEISNDDFWVKIIEMLQQNWALIEPYKNKAGCVVYFVGDDSGVFDQIEFDDIAEAKRQLRINGFRRYEEDDKFKEFVVTPTPPFHKSSHPNGLIYSSGQFWKSNI